MTGSVDASTRLELDGPIDLRRTCAPLTAGGGDPTWSLRADRVARSLHTPDGPATLRWRLAAGAIDVQGWGPGAGWAVARAHLTVGLHDRVEGFRPELHPTVARLVARSPLPRFAASVSPWDAVVPVVLGQRVTTGEARTSWYRLVHRHGSAAPGPLGLRLGPGPVALRRLGVADWHVLGVERRRADTVRRLAAVVPALQRAADTSGPELERVVSTVDGVGRWTATALAAGVVGDPDTVLLGDLHVPHIVCHALAGEQRGDDDRMLELLEPWRGHRGRVVRLLKGARLGPQRRAPRYTPIPIARW